MKDDLLEYNASQTTGDELTLRELVERVRTYAKEIRRSWWIVALICLPFLAWQGYLALNTPVKYETNLTFMVDETSGGSANLLSSVLGNFGIGGSKDNNDRIIELAKSMRIVREALFSQIEIEGKRDFLINHFIRLQNLHEEEWAKKPKSPNQPSLQGFLFTRDSSEQFTRLENTALKSVYGILLGDEKHKALFSTRADQDSGIMTLSLTTRSEELTIILLRAIFDRLSTFYILSSTEKQQETFNIVRAKADSLRQLLTSTEYRAARFKEQNNLVLRPTDQLPSERLSREKGMYNLIYGESLKNLEIADFALRNKAPYIQPIDLPIPPLTGVPYGKSKALAIGLGLGLLVGILFVVARKIWRDATRKVNLQN